MNWAFEANPVSAFEFRRERVGQLIDAIDQLGRFQLRPDFLDHTTAVHAMARDLVVDLYDPNVEGASREILSMVRDSLWYGGDDYRKPEVRTAVIEHLVHLRDHPEIRESDVRRAFDEFFHLGMRTVPNFSLDFSGEPEDADSCPAPH
jgi:hypothetical protein